MKTYWDCAELYKHRRKGSNWKRLSHNQVMYYDVARDCYQHKHHNTITVEIFPDKYKLYIDGWDTVTTWQKIREFAPLRYTVHIPGASHKLFINGRGSAYPFHEGIELDYEGSPIDPQPYTITKRILKKGMCREFTRVRRTVTDRVLPRVLIGEFDEKKDDKFGVPVRRNRWESTPGVPTGSTLWDCMVMIAESSLDVPLEHDMIAPLLVPRPVCSFGKEIYKQPERTPMQLLNGAFNAARADYHKRNGHYEFKVTTVQP